MNLLEQLGLDPTTFTWHDLALCNKIDSPDLFFEDYEKSQNVAKQIDDMCLHCPVMKQCAEAGMDGQQGVWGGIYWNGSGKADTNKNSHKTEETWNQIKERLAS